MIALDPSYAFDPDVVEIDAEKSEEGTRNAIEENHLTICHRYIPIPSVSSLPFDSNGSQIYV